MQLIRSLIFNIFLYVGLITIFILAIPTLFLPSKFTIFFGRLSAKYIVLILRIILNTKVIFHGVENLKKVENYFELANNIMNSLWVRNQDVDNEDVLINILNLMNLNSKKIISFAKSEECKKIFEEYTQLAIKKNVFGAPTYIINDQIYWGQDRLDFVERHLLSLN